MARNGRQSTIYTDATTADGRGLPVTVDSRVTVMESAGISPDAIDNAIMQLVKQVEDGATLINTSGVTLERLMKHLNRELDKQIRKLEAEYEAQEDAPPGEVVRGLTAGLAESLDMAGKVTTILDRLNKMMTNAVKSQDQAVRLRTFIAGGEEDDGGLSGKSENHLRRLINATLAGDMIPPEQRRAG